MSVFGNVASSILFTLRFPVYAAEISTTLIISLKTPFSFKISEMFRVSSHVSYV